MLGFDARRSLHSGPANTQVLTTADFDHAKSPSMFEALVRAALGVSLSDQTGNPFQRDLQYRGFTASPLIGTPQGLAVYSERRARQRGVRRHCQLGLDPDVAVHRLSQVPDNPVLGLNAIGGAISVDMKNGFTYQGKPTDTLTFAGNAYFRGYWHHHLGGNNTSAQFCDPGSAHLLCFGDGSSPLNGADSLVISTSATPSQLDCTQTNAASYGGSFQATSTAKILDHPTTLWSACASIAATCKSTPPASSQPSIRTCSSTAPASSSTRTSSHP